MSAEAIWGIMEPAAVLAERAAGRIDGFIAFDDAGDASDLGAEEVPEAEDEGEGGDDEEGVGEDDAEGGIGFDFEGGEDGGAEDERAGDGGEDAEREHDASGAASAAAFADDAGREADVVRVDGFGEVRHGGEDPLEGSWLGDNPRNDRREWGGVHGFGEGRVKYGGMRRDILEWIQHHNEKGW